MGVLWELLVKESNYFLKDLVWDSEMSVLIAFALKECHDIWNKSFWGALLFVFYFSHCQNSGEEIKDFL